MKAARLRVALAAVALAACGSGGSAPETSPDCDVGAEGCACTGGGACDEGLTCVTGTCRSEADSGMPPDSGGDGVFDEADFGDFADCAARCGNPYDLVPLDIELAGVEDDGSFTVNGTRYSALRGGIDDGDHMPGYAYDLDFLRIVVPARRMIEVAVSPLSGSAMDPYVSTFDPELEEEAPLYGWMTQNDSEGESSSARSVILSPLGPSEPWFVVVDDAVNVSGERRVGGEDYGYEVRFRSLGAASFVDLELDELGNASLGGRELVRSGDIDYFRFVDAGHGSYVIDFTTENSDFCGHLWQIDLNQGAAWLVAGATDDTPDDGCESTLSFQTYASFYQEGTEAYAFVVTDYMGRGSDSGLGDFVYDLAIRVADEP